MNGASTVRTPRVLSFVVMVAAAFLALPAGAASKPAGAAAGGFDLLHFFEGTSFSKGTVDALFTRTEAFTARFTGRRHGEWLDLDERFTFPDGRRLQRWHLRATGAGGYEGSVATELKDGRMAPPVGVKGRVTAHGAILDYDGYAPGGGDTVLHFHHVMTAEADGTVSNHVTVSKFYLPLAVSDVVFAKTLRALAMHRR